LGFVWWFTIGTNVNQSYKDKNQAHPLPQGVINFVDLRYDIIDEIFPAVA